MSVRWIELGEQEAGLGPAGVADNETWKREAILNEVLCVFFWRLKQRRKLLVSLLLLVPSFSPLSHSFTVEDEDMEEGVKQKDSLVLNRLRIEEHRLATLVFKTVAVQSRLNHNERVAHVFVIQHMPIESRLVGRIVEDLQELRPTKMEHKLWVQREVLLEPVRVSLGYVRDRTFKYT